MRIRNHIVNPLVAFVLAPSLFTHPVNITGHLKKNPKDSSVRVDKISVVVKGDNKVLAQAISDSNGDFELTFTPAQEKSFDFFCTGLGIDTMLIESVTTFESDTPVMTFYIPSNYKRNVWQKVICPKCKRVDKVFKIQYGDPVVSTMLVNKSGDTTYSPIYKGFYRAGCLVQPANYYCARDRVKF